MVLFPRGGRQIRRPEIPRRLAAALPGGHRAPPQGRQRGVVESRRLGGGRAGGQGLDRRRAAALLSLPPAEAASPLAVSHRRLQLRRAARRHGAAAYLCAASALLEPDGEAHALACGAALRRESAAGAYRALGSRRAARRTAGGDRKRRLPDGMAVAVS